MGTPPIEPNPTALTPAATDAINNQALVGGKPPMEPRGSMEEPLVVPEVKANPLFEDRVNEDAERRERAKNAAAADAPKSAAGLSMGNHQRIVDVLFDLPDPMEVYERVRRGLSFGGRASSLGYGALVDALDEAETHAADAFQLMCDAKVIHDRFEIDAKVIWGSLREKAYDDLLAQKIALKTDTKTTGKAITNDDIEGVMAKKFPDEYRDLESRRSRAKRMVSLMEDLAERCRERAKDLRAMCSKARDA